MKYLLPLLLITSAANAAVWERPSGAYTPTNHSVNITKYQTDRANKVAISDVKVDGDINKAFQGLNDIEARTAPSVVGNAGKYLTNDGTSILWQTLDTSLITSGTVSVTANLAGTVSITAGTTSYFHSGGLVTFGISATAVTATTLSGHHLGAVGISATTVTATTLNAGQITISGALSAASATFSGNVSGQIKTGTAIATTSGTAVDFTGIPATVKRITVMFNGTSTNGSNLVQVQLGTSGGIQTTAYTSDAIWSGGTLSSTSGLLVGGANAANTRHGSMIISNMGSSTWVSQGNVSANGNTFVAGGSVTLGGTLERVRVTTVGGTDTFDAGSVNLLWE